MDEILVETARMMGLTVAIGSAVLFTAIVGLVLYLALLQGKAERARQSNPTP